ncbi:MAG: amidohydrolase family protein [Idiomarina sp.]|nr:amidohydrolase family protein [Idiomarina sp.]
MRNKSRLNQRYPVWVLAFVAGLGVAACDGGAADDHPINEQTFSNDLANLLDGSEVFTAGYIWDGRSDSYLENGAMVVREGRMMAIFSTDQQALPDSGVNVTELGDHHYVIPGLINAHGHVGVADGLDAGAAVASEELVRQQLMTYAQYGITSVVSLGDEPAEAFTVRDSINPRNPQMARLWVAGDVLDPQDTSAARDQVAEAVEHNPDWLKIRVDSQLGRREAMSGEVYTQVIASAHEAQLPLASHMVTLEHAKGLLRAGTDLIAHSVRDTAVDDELIDLMLAQEVCITPTLTRELSTYVYAERPEFFDDPFFRQSVSDDVLEQLQQPEVQARFRGADADYYETALPLAKDNMMHMFAAGVGVAMGTDSGPPARFQGYFEHLEMEMMENAGMTAIEVMKSASSVAAQCMGLAGDLGELEAGRWADFVVLAADPMQSTENLRSIEAVYIGGELFTPPVNR